MYKQAADIFESETANHSDYTMLQLPMPPSRGQDESSGVTRGYQKKTYYNQCYKWLPNLAFIPGRNFPWTRVIWWAEAEVKNPYDADNLMSLCKWPIDFLIKAGVIANDNPCDVWAPNTPKQKVNRKKGAILLMTIHLWSYDGVV